MVIGTLVGLTAIRLSGLYLALITLMFAGATTVVLSVIDFPNGGGGFTGRTSSPDLSGLAAVRRPSLAEATPRTTATSSIVAAIMFVLALIHVAGKPGPRVGVDPRERAGRAGGGREHHASTRSGRSRWRRS